MRIINIARGRDIKLKGLAKKCLVNMPLPNFVAVQPPDFPGLRLKPIVKAGDKVKVGTPIFFDKGLEQRKVVSPVSGEVHEIVRGEKRALLAIVIKSDGRQTAEKFAQYSEQDLPGLSREDICQQLLASGVWPCLRQRPFSNIADPEVVPKSIFVQANHTEPLAPEIDFILDGQEKLFQSGLDLLQKLTEGQVFLSCPAQPKTRALKEATGVEICGFSGAHPAGNISTAIHYLDPIQKGDIVWWIQAQDVVRIAELFYEGRFSPTQIVAITGEGAKNAGYKKTVLGAPLKHLVECVEPENFRFISGSILRGNDVGLDGYLCFYDAQITVFPKGGSREFLGWIMPGANKVSFSRTFLSSLKKKESVSLGTGLHGGQRAIILNHIYDDYVALDIMTNFLLRAVYAGDLDEAERLGILECDEEDFALCTFACPSKLDVGQVIRQGLERIELEG